MTVTTAQARHQAGLYRVTGTPVAASIVVSLCDQLDALTLALETERDAANLYAKQVAHWIGKHDALLEQQLEAQAAQPAQHTAAIKTLEHLGYTYHGAEYWKPPLGKRPAQPGWKPTDASMTALRRFEETCSDGEGYDVPKDTMKQLALIGLVAHVSGGRYVITDFGQSVLSAAPSTKEQSNG